jgi:hypothetical protein
VKSDSLKKEVAFYRRHRSRMDAERTVAMNRFLKYFFIVWAINLVLFFILTFYLGVDAINGKIIDGHYFLTNHGRLTEVSHRVFVYSEVHTVVFIVLGVVAMPLAIIAKTAEQEESPERAAYINASLGHYPILPSLFATLLACWISSKTSVCSKKPRGGIAKHLAKIHQFLGVNKAISAAQQIRANQGELGLFWHRAPAKAFR